MTMFYGLQWTNTETGETSLCEVERHVVYEIGTRLEMKLHANAANREARQGKWPSRYRAVPLPFTGEKPFEDDDLSDAALDAVVIQRIGAHYQEGRITFKQYVDSLRRFNVNEPRCIRNKFWKAFQRKWGK